MVAAGAPIDTWIARTLKREPPRSKSLLVTIFGDSIVPYADGIWLSDLIALLDPFGVNERLVRTSGFRLVEEGWLEAQREGRRSRYSLTPDGLKRVEHAGHRIYEAPPAEWDGRWTMVISRRAGSPVSDRVELRRELGWEGFGLLTAGVFLHPCADLEATREVLERLALTDSVVVLEARELGAISTAPVRSLVEECWNLEAIAGEYRRFLEEFGRVPEMLEAEVDGQREFVVQTLMVHAFRRVVLHDPRLPAELLPADWPGHAAYALAGTIYRGTFERVQKYVAGRLGPGGRLQPKRELRQLFGGLERGGAVPVNRVRG